MHQSPKAAAQAVTDLAQRIGASQLTEQHGDELRPAGKAFGGTLSSVLLYEYGELGSGKVMEQLIKQACDLYDWVALLWAAFGEFPARNGSPTSIIGGHSSYFRLQEPVLDKSDETSSAPAAAPSPAVGRTSVPAPFCRLGSRQVAPLVGCCRRSSRCCG